MSTTKNNGKPLTHYLSLSYPYELTRDEEGFVASHPDLLGCLAQGDTADEAVKELDSARRAWLEVRFEEGLPIPEPVDEAAFSGKILLRIPPALHAALARRARQQDASLNQLLNNALSEYVGAERRESELAAALMQGIERLESRLASHRAPISLGKLNASVSVPLEAGRISARRKGSA